MKHNQAEIDIYWMQYALDLADRAEMLGEVPIGAVLIDEQNNLIGEGWNQPIYLHDPSAHAEIMALRQAGEKLQNYRLLNTTLYVTLEPCAMCAGAILHSRIKRLVFATPDYKTGVLGSRFHLFNDYNMNHRVQITQGVLQAPCSEKLSQFFQRRRKEKKQAKINHQD